MIKKYAIIKFRKEFITKTRYVEPKDDFVLLSYKNIKDIPNGCGDCYLTKVKIILSTNNCIKTNNKYWKYNFPTIQYCGKNTKFCLIKDHWKKFIGLRRGLESQTLKDIKDDDSAKLIFELGEYNG